MCLNFLVCVCNSRHFNCKLHHQRCFWISTLACFSFWIGLSFANGFEPNRAYFSCQNISLGRAPSSRITLSICFCYNTRGNKDLVESEWASFRLLFIYKCINCWKMLKCWTKTWWNEWNAKLSTSQPECYSCHKCRTNWFVYCLINEGHWSLRGCSLFGRVMMTLTVARPTSCPSKGDIL